MISLAQSYIAYNSGSYNQLHSMPENNATEVVVPLIEVEEKVIDNAIRLKILKALSREGIF